MHVCVHACAQKCVQAHLIFKHGHHTGGFALACRLILELLP